MPGFDLIEYSLSTGQERVIKKTYYTFNEDIKITLRKF